MVVCKTTAMRAVAALRRVHQALPALAGGFYFRYVLLCLCTSLFLVSTPATPSYVISTGLGVWIQIIMAMANKRP